MLDVYWIGENNRQSPEADIPIIDKSAIEYRLGGAANVAGNLASLGLTPILISAVGKDQNGDRVLQMCQEQFDNPIIQQIENHITTTKTRIVDKTFKQWLRVDDEEIESPNLAQLQVIKKALNEVISKSKVGAIILQDYNKGLISDSLIEHVISIADASQIPIFVDPKRDNFVKLSKCTVFKPNLKELGWALGKAIEASESSLSQAIEELGLLSEYIFVTLADKGIFYYVKNDGKSGIVPGFKIDDPDVSGAGDTVLATLVWTYINGDSVLKMAKTANLAGYKVCQKKGVSKINLADIIG